MSGNEQQLKKLNLTIVIPVKNEALNIEIISVQIISAMRKHINIDYEVIFIDDHSTDNTYIELIKVKDKYHEIKIDVEKLGTGKGKDQALIAGMIKAKGELIAIIDGDLQNDPEDIPVLLAEINNFDMVCGIRTERKCGIKKKIVSKIANYFRNRLTGENITDAGCALKVMRKECLAGIYFLSPLLTGTAHLFYPAILKMTGYKIKQVTVKDRLRIHGKSKFKIIKGRLFAGIKACIVIRYLKKNWYNEKLKLI